ncbi:MAG TPA: hypothetical protein PLK90_10710 [Clostridiales bacterium]|jgi:hypothetical protein|nr:hypothetical protein [Clostridiales bacterium]HQP70860.1 hypothetical protein [Clostridiales bacterium]
MENAYEISKIRNHYCIECGRVSQDVLLYAGCCSEKLIREGERETTGLVISGETEIIYLTLEEAAKGEVFQKIEKECEYVLEF